MKRKNIISLFLLSAGCMLPLCASAQHVYSLDECIEAALDNNVRMKNAQNNLRMVEHSKQEAFSKYVSHGKCHGKRVPRRQKSGTYGTITRNADGLYEKRTCG